MVIARNFNTKKMEQKMTELQEQAHIWQWHWNTFADERKRLIRLKNELDNHPPKKQIDKIKQLAENKATGIIKGTPDFMYFSAIGLCFIEHKTLDGVQSEEQKEFAVLAAEFTIPYFLTYGIDNAKKLINELRELGRQSLG